MRNGFNFQTASYGHLALLRQYGDQIVQFMYLSNTTLFDAGSISSIYYIRYNYMFRRLSIAIFRLYMKYLISSYMRLNMGCIQWGGRS